MRPDSTDHLPILGKGEVLNLFFATGHFRNGILLAPITAQIISDLVLNGPTSSSLDCFSLKRFSNGKMNDKPNTATVSYFAGVDD